MKNDTGVDTAAVAKSHRVAMKTYEFEKCARYYPGRAAAIAWQEDYAELLSSYDCTALDAAILSYIRRYIPALPHEEAESVYGKICIAFAKITIEPIRTLSSEGRRQFEELRSKFNVILPDAPSDNESKLFIPGLPKEEIERRIGQSSYTVAYRAEEKKWFE